jgi:hypothetical protein
MDTVYTLRKISDGTSTSEQQQRQRSIELLKGLLANIASTEERAAAAKLLAEMETAGEESKANKVFNIVELVTLIVEDLGTKDLAVLARLNKATYGAIKRSPVTRRKLEMAQAFFSSPIERPHDPFIPWAHCGALKLILDSEGIFDEETGEYEVTDWLLFFDFDCDEYDKVPHSEQVLDRLICKPPVYKSKRGCLAASTWRLAALWARHTSLTCRLPSSHRTRASRYASCSKPITSSETSTNCAPTTGTRPQQTTTSKTASSDPTWSSQAAWSWTGKILSSLRTPSGWSKSANRTI